MTKSVYWKDVAFPGDIADLRSVGTGGLILPAGTTPQQPAVPENGTFRYNTTIGLSEVYQGGAWSTISTTGISGEANDGINLGAGQAVFESKVGFDLQFKSIVGGTNVVVGSNANEIVINAVGTGEVNTASNVGVGTGTVFDSKIGDDLQFKSLRSLTPNLTIVNNSNTIDFDLLGGLGEANDGVNLGTGDEIFLNKVGLNLRFRTLNGAANEISLTPSATELEVGLADNPIMPGNASMIVPSGPTTAQPAPVDGMIRYDTTTLELRTVVNGVWQTLETSAGTFLPLSGGVMVGDIDLAAGVNIVGGNSSTITLQAPLIMVAGADIDMTAGGDINMQALATIDGRDIDVDGVVLDNINTPTSFGMVARISDPDGFARRTLTGTTDQIVITNGDGVAGDPTFSIADNPVFAGTGSVTVPFGTTAQQPVAPTDGMFRINTTDSVVEYYISGNWIRSISTIGGAVTGGDIDMGGNDITNVGLTDGRDLGADGIIIDQLDALVPDTGVMVRTATGYNTRLVVANTDIDFLGASVIGGNGTTDIEIGIDIANLPVGTTLIGTEQLIAYDPITGGNVTNTVDDIVTYIGASGVSGEIDVVGEFGFVARIADGTPVGNFERRSLVPSVFNNRVGISVDNGDGIAGDPEIGLALFDLPVVTSVADTDQIVMYDPTGLSNVSATVATTRNRIMSGVVRASDSTVAVPIGLSVLPFTATIDPELLFNNGTDTYTPPSGVFEITGYAQANTTTNVGTYILRILRNGVAEGNIGVLTVDGVNLAVGNVEDVYQASGTDEFSIEIQNTTGSASTFDAVRFYAHRVY